MFLEGLLVVQEQRGRKSLMQYYLLRLQRGGRRMWGGMALLMRLRVPKVLAVKAWLVVSDGDKEPVDGKEEPEGGEENGGRNRRQ